MALEGWLPIGFELPDGARVRKVLTAGADWQILEAEGGGRALVVTEKLARKWIDSNLIAEGALNAFRFGERQIRSLSCAPSQILAPVSEGRSPNNKAEALAFSLALKATRSLDGDSPLQDALYVEKITRLLPTYSISSKTPDDVVLGYWLTGGSSIPATSFRRLRQTMSWLGASHLKDVVQAAGIEVAEIIPSEKNDRPRQAVPNEIRSDTQKQDASQVESNRAKVFALPGRPELADFFNEHVVDIILHRERYKSLGIEFPSAIILHGPPGCGKTFAVERLVDFLGWPTFQIDASSVASPYIHETSKKVAQVFEKAIENAPSVLVIDEMEAFLADRGMGAGSSHHRVEEVAEFLRRIPEAVANEVLIVAMTNRIDMIDPAIQRRGRFDHVIEVELPSETEVKSLLDSLLSSLPTSSDVDAAAMARKLARRPLSDVAFVVREGARLAARSGKERIDQTSLDSALQSSPARGGETSASARRIGFV